jgi:hypothetical protein
MKIAMITDVAYVYVLSCPQSGHTKVGISVHPSVRVGQVRSPKGRRPALELERGPLTKARSVEKVAHEILADKRVRDEWFSASLDECLEAIDKAANIIGAEVVSETQLRKKKKPLKVQASYRLSPWLVAGVEALRLRQQVTPPVNAIVEKALETFLRKHHVGAEDPDVVRVLRKMEGIE